MRIIETGINDFPVTDLNDEKIRLSNEVISFVQPIFTNEYREKIRQIKVLKKEISKKREKIQLEKNELQSLFTIRSKKEKENQLLKKFEQLIQNDLIQESMKKNLVSILNSFDTMSEEKITSYLNNVTNILSKKFAKK
jgi:hypothetical protein